MSFHSYTLDEIKALGSYRGHSVSLNILSSINQERKRRIHNKNEVNDNVVLSSGGAFKGPFSIAGQKNVKCFQF